MVVCSAAECTAKDVVGNLCVCASEGAVAVVGDVIDRSS